MFLQQLFLALLQFAVLEGSRFDLLENLHNSILES